jgi:hypothetical protein
MRITRKHIGRQIRKLNRAKGAGATLDILDKLKSNPDLYWAVKRNW